ncbi:Nucleoside-diphosphate-sugar epimerase [Chitinophaga sp. CF118]|uniref:NAD-dependent epimerase/dehydratase family protein n=1 Tax=Chitinophaga sp. CF118 TaxID=1884367 RepID=UPI0008E6A6C4|nr:NAD(P)-dependent oxidoreductase [Chitinophaga sp. CF118]SFE01947.1 Nucleoside-diphosphate-sugar epimerase [Chitinophaga sp. CF118]
MKPRILITGASGFIGYHLISAALNAGMEVHAAIRSSSKISQLQHFNLKYVIPDYTDTDSLCKLLEEYQYSYIVHAAGVTRANSEEEYKTLNAVYTLNLAKAARAADIPLEKFVFISSLAALGPVSYNATWPIPDGANANPITMYGQSKLLAEELLAGQKDLPWVVLRPTAVYGPLERDLFVLFKTFKRGMEIHVGRTPQQLSFVYVKDLADAVILALTAPPIHTGYNVSDGNSYDRYALANIFKRSLGVNMLRIHIPTPLVKLFATVSEKVSRGIPLLNNEKLRELNAQSWNCNIEQIRRDLGFNPNYNLETGMKETLNWYKENKWF